jgi:four helix bundle protein
MPIKSYKELIVWQKSILLVAEIYIITKLLPESEVFGLISQMQRASVSIASNIAEGFGRKHPKEFIHFLSIAYGSALELETQLIIVKQQYSGIQSQKAEDLLVEEQKMLKALMSKINFHTKD